MSAEYTVEIEVAFTDGLNKERINKINDNIYAALEDKSLKLIVFSVKNTEERVANIVIEITLRSTMVETGKVQSFVEVTKEALAVIEQAFPYKMFNVITLLVT